MPATPAPALAPLCIGPLELASPLLLAPIAGYCDLSFRLTIRSLGGLGLACTDLVNPRGLLRGTVRSLELVETTPEDRPLCVQLYGTEASEMAEAARQCVDQGAVVIDINMGCPVDKVCRTNGGSALLRDPLNAARLAEHVVRAVSTPVTVKMRLGWDEERAVAPGLARDLESAGVAAVTVHGRTAAQRFGGHASLEGIAAVVAAVQRIPVIGNGDVRTPQDALRMVEATGCAGIMIGRGALSDPWLFRDSLALLSGAEPPPPPTRAERIDFMNRHFEHLLALRGERRACVAFRQRISWYLKRMETGAAFRGRMSELDSAAQYRELISELSDQSR